MSDPDAIDAAADNGPRDLVAQAMWNERLRREREGRPTALEIMNVLDDELNRILASQRAMIEAALRIEPAPGEIKKAIVYEQALLLLQNIIKNADKLRPILYPKATRK